MPIITLTSDFGEADYLAGAVKGMLLKSFPDCQLVDISHRLEPFNDHKAAHVVSNSVFHYPHNSYHLILSNLFHEPADHLLLVKHQHQYLLLADNGLITMILNTGPEEIIALPLNPSNKPNLFNFVEVFSNAISLIETGRPLQEVGIPLASYKGKKPLKSVVTEEYLDGQILYIDAFENVIINITRQEFDASRKSRPFKIIFKRHHSIEKISNTYADVQPGETLALFNAANYLEIAINKGNAAGLFGLHGYSENNKAQYGQSRLSYQMVRVQFE
jgi:S-adenosylmethionine hydrolase